MGVCVDCRKAICIECSTPMAGIHRCAKCLKGMAPREPEKAEGSGARAWLLAGSGLLLSAAGWAAVAAIFG